MVLLLRYCQQRLATLAVSVSVSLTGEVDLNPFAVEILLIRCNHLAAGVLGSEYRRQQVYRFLLLTTEIALNLGLLVLLVILWYAYTVSVISWNDYTNR